jgi:circadian clock protein KaiC
VLSLLRFFVERGATLLFSSEPNEETPDYDLQFVCDGVIELDAAAHGRRIRVRKLRGSDFRGGWHGMRLTGEGMRVYPRLVPAEHMREFTPEPISSGVPELDKLLHGGLERGTVTIITGPSGVGKTTLGLQFMKEAARRGERSVLYAFEEEKEIILRRAESLNVPVREMIDQEKLLLQRVEPLRLSADEFAMLVRQEVEERQTRLVMLDSVAGYRLTLHGEQLTTHLHALAKYLQNMGVAVLLVAECSQVVGGFRVSDADITYLADNVLFIRYLEIDGQLRRAIGVLKKRLTDFEQALREFRIGPTGIIVGEPLTGLRGILGGLPEWVRPKKAGET